MSNLAQEYLELHSNKIKDHYAVMGISAMKLLLAAVESEPGEDNGMGEIVFEISGADSHTGNPILFEVPRRWLK